MHVVRPYRVCMYFRIGLLHNDRPCTIFVLLATVLCTICICVDQTFVVAHAGMTMIVHYHTLSLCGIHTTEQSVSVFVGVKFVPLICHNCKKSHSGLKLKSATNRRLLLSLL